MHDNLSSIVISVASGKGGVGKTCIAANLAYIASRLGRTLLLDLDLQNQGCTSLLAHQADDTVVNCYDIVINGIGESEYGIELRDNLFFIPATSWKTPPKQQDIYNVLNSLLAKDNLKSFLDATSTNRNFDFIIIDCHGGIDLLSYFAYHHSTYTLIVTEPDVVTFSGTLELIRFYEQSIELSQTTNAEDLMPITAPEARDSKTDVKFVVNRLQGKLSLKSLQKLYKPYVGGGFRGVSSDSTVFCYIPSEDMICDTFGQVPFFAEIVPKSMFAKKIMYMAYELLSPHVEIKPETQIFKKFKKEKFRKRIYSAVRSIEQVAKQRALTFVAITVGFFIAASLLGTSVAIALSSFKRADIGGVGTLRNPAFFLYVIYFVVVAYGLIAMGNAYFIRVLHPLIKLYGQRIAFEKGLRRISGAGLVVFGRLRLALISVFRLGLWMMLVVTSIAALGSIIVVAVGLFDILLGRLFVMPK